MSTTKPIIAIVPGDCTGIGPEQTARMFAEGRARDVARLIYVGDIRVLKLGMRQAKVDVKYKLVRSPSEAPSEATENENSRMPKSGRKPAAWCRAPAHSCRLRARRSRL